MKKAKLTAGDVVLELELHDNATAEAIYASLPIKGKADHWGEECHFATEAMVDEPDNVKDVVDVGDVVYLQDDNTIAIGFGPTLWSKDEEVRFERPASVWASCKGDVTSLIFVPNEEIITIEAV